MAKEAKSNISRLSLTSRDYASIYSDLVAAIPTLTQTWTSREETDPGIVIIKLISMVGDMLSFNQDKMALEVYPESVTQRKNAQQIFNLIGYKMHWYRSARCNATLTNINPSPATVPRFTKFVTADDKICYTNIAQIELPSNTVNNSTEYQLELVQGTPRTPALENGNLVPGYNEAWHSVYTYNVVSKDIISNRLYLTDSDVDESTIFLVDDLGDEWIQVNNVDVMISTGKYFELKIDEYDRAYLKLVEYWDRFDINRFKLFYIISDGEAGQISGNALTKVSSKVYTISGTSSDRDVQDISDDIRITNRGSTFGYNPETPDEARKESAKYVNTYDTLITLDDFTRATSRLPGVANCIALDCTNDPDPDLDSYVVKIYITREDAYEDMDNESYIEMINTELRDYKLMPLKLIIDLTSTNYYYWTVTGKVYLNEPSTLDKGNDVLVKINNNLRYLFSQEKVNYNETIGYIDVVDAIESADPAIHHVDLDPIEYRNSDSEIVSKQEINGEYTQEIPNHPREQSKYVYKFNAENAPIKPGTLSIRLENGLYILTDNGNGKVIDSSGILRQSGSVNYATGEIEFEIVSLLNVPILMNYKKNAVSMCRYQNFNTQYFNIATESIKRS